MAKPRKHRHPSPNSNSVSPRYLLVFGIIWTVFSSTFVAVPLAGPIAALPQLTWRQVPCVVDRFEIADDRKHQKPFSPELSFRFQWAAAPQAEADATAPLLELTGTRLRAGDSRDRDYAALAKLRENILARPTPVCWVNPADPSQAVLQRGVPNLGSALGMACFGGCFVAIGIGLLVTAALQRRATDRVERNTAPTPTRFSAPPPAVPPPGASSPVCRRASAPPASSTRASPGKPSGIAPSAGAACC